MGVSPVLRKPPRAGLTELRGSDASALSQYSQTRRKARESASCRKTTMRANLRWRIRWMWGLFEVVECARTGIFTTEISA